VASGHELFKLTTEALTAWVAVFALFAAIAAVIVTRNSEKEADAQDFFSVVPGTCLQ
jgi:hypothetical protein